MKLNRNLDAKFLQIEIRVDCRSVSSMYIWSEMFRSPSESKYGGHGGLDLRRFQSPTRSFMFMCYVKTAQGD